MKHLILLLLISLSFSVNGQIVKNEAYNSSTSIHKYKSGPDTNYMFISSLLQLWDDYSKECTKDSIQVVKVESCFPGSGVGHGYATWQHKEPTFEGFVEYLRKKK